MLAHQVLWVYKHHCMSAAGYRLLLNHCSLILQLIIGLKMKFYFNRFGNLLFLKNKYCHGQRAVCT